ncbi:MAG: hypothetical protein A3H48_03735 [Candidatus Rokubacteria bacterium RIFCSPLOWO2_02_FULL_71_18]|nr:MAG: hypothetical protein A3H48_03735 [Candidatus Rokubacteria bacterium RIFCSPLOWO2_02_FULL_71_18]
MVTRPTPHRSDAAHRAAGRVLDILEALTRGPEFTLTELSRTLGVPKSSLLALLRTFVDRGYLEHQPTGAYRIGPRAIEMGFPSPFQRELPALAGPVLLDLAEKSGESVFLALLIQPPPEVVYVDKVESRQRIRYTASLGERRPLHCTAPGLAIFAFMPEAERDRLLESVDLTPFTDVTVTDRDVLRARLEEVRSTGVAINVDEFVAGASGIAAPIFDRAGAVVAACTVIGPTGRLLTQQDDLARWVKAAGDAVSRRLGFQPG